MPSFMILHSFTVAFCFLLQSPEDRRREQIRVAGAQLVVRTRDRGERVGRARMPEVLRRVAAEQREAESPLQIVRGGLYAAGIAEAAALREHVHAVAVDADAAGRFVNQALDER